MNSLKRQCFIGGDLQSGGEQGQDFRPHLSRRSICGNLQRRLVLGPDIPAVRLPNQFEGLQNGASLPEIDALELTAESAEATDAGDLPEAARAHIHPGNRRGGSRALQGG